MKNIKKKQQIGFFNVKESNCKSGNNSENDENDEQKPVGQIPNHIVNEIEEHVLAKQEYENSMNKLYRYQKYFKNGLYILGFIGICLIFYIGFYCGSKYTLNKLQEEISLKESLMNAFQKGFEAGKMNIKNNTNDNIKMK